MIQSKSFASQLQRVSRTNLALRDGQQSTLDGKDWVMDTAEMAKILKASQRAGFNSAEVAGGQSFQIAISNGYNPFAIVDALSNAMRDEKGEKTIELQMLFRGANALGFRHYDKDVVEATLNEFYKNGITKIRFFDALNDIDNLDLPESIKSKKGLILQAALCFGHYKQAADRYSDSYYVNYAKELVAKGFNHIAIKDMSGQMTSERMRSLLPKLQGVLQPAGVPLELHIHSTNAATSLEASRTAIELGVDSIETVEGPLKGGSSHHDWAEICGDSLTSDSAYSELQRLSKKIWGGRLERRDSQVEAELKDQLCSAGVPGGAMPFVIRDLRTQMPTIVAKYLKVQQAKIDREYQFASKLVHKKPELQSAEVSFSDVIGLFIEELKRVCQDAAYPLLVTPTADICCKQAIANLAFGENPYGESLKGRYLSSNQTTGADPRFTKLVLGHYGELKAYDGSGSIIQPDVSVIEFFEDYNSHGFKRVIQHPSTQEQRGDMEDARAAAWKLIQAIGPKVLSFANFDQLTLMYALKPASAPGVDPVAKAVHAYADRAGQAKINGTGVTFPGYETIMQPILDHLGAWVAVRPDFKVEQAIEIKLGDLGVNLYRRLYRAYATLPITLEVTRVLNNLTNLVSSDHTSDQLKLAVAFVGDSFRNLDFHPKNQEEQAYEQARETFRELTIGQLFGALALTHSLVNSVDKHGTLPQLTAEKAITIEDLAAYSRSVNASNLSQWERKLSYSIRSRHTTVERDLCRRLKAWLD